MKNQAGDVNIITLAVLFCLIVGGLAVYNVGLAVKNFNETVGSIAYEEETNAGT